MDKFYVRKAMDKFDRMPIFSPFASSKDGYRIIEIDVNHAKLNLEKQGKYYVDISVNRGQHCLQTKQQDCSTSGGKYSILWNQKFVFSVPKQFIFDQDSTVSFTLLRTHKYLLDPVVGKARIGMKSLFPIAPDKARRRAIRELEDKYDLEETNKIAEEEEDCDYIKEERPFMEAFKLAASIELPIRKGSSEEGKLGVSITAWEKYYPDHELSLCGKNSRVYEVFQGGSDKESVGSLCVEKVAEEKYVKCVGNHVRWRNLAMEYQEFRMHGLGEREEQHHPLERGFGYY